MSDHIVINLPVSMTKEDERDERALKEALHELQRKYVAASRPLLDQLSKIYARYPRRPLIVPGDFFAPNDKGPPV